MYYGGIEAGGTKFICAVCDENMNVIDEVNFPTTTPEETVRNIFNFFDRFELKSIGIGSFGPIGIDKSKDTYGFVLMTPKEGWTNFNFLGTIKERYNVPCAWTTDVNAAAYAELKLGAAKGKSSCIYLTVGTGIGGGAIINNELLQRLNHPEMGHIFVKKHDADDYAGCCPYHKGCLEGLASGPSLEARTGKKGEILSEDNPVWEKQAYYLAQALINYTLTLTPEMIILGGGVMNQDHLIRKIRKKFKELMNGYVELPPLDEYIVPWSMPGESGIKGALLLAKDSL